MKSLLTTLLLLSPLLLRAQTFTLPNYAAGNSIVEVIVIALSRVIPILLVLAVLSFVYFGVQFVLAQGQPDKISKARAGLFWSILGAILIVGANALANAFIRTLGEL